MRSISYSRLFTTDIWSRINIVIITWRLIARHNYRISRLISLCSAYRNVVTYYAVCWGNERLRFLLTSKTYFYWLANVNFPASWIREPVKTISTLISINVCKSHSSSPLSCKHFSSSDKMLRGVVTRNCYVSTYAMQIADKKKSMSLHKKIPYSL